MPVTIQELDSFRQFASEKLGNGGADSMRQLVEQWEAARERSDVNAIIALGVEEMNAGGGRPARDVMEELSQKYNLK